MVKFLPYFSPSPALDVIREKTTEQGIHRSIILRAERMKEK